jgi:two-component system chemotaxis response regulator CheB
MTTNDFDIIVLGGSSGSIPVVTQIISALPADLRIPVVIIIHRMKNVESELQLILSAKRKIYEPEDKEQVKAGMIYLAPQNYHLLVEDDNTFCLDYSEPVNYSRPSIDVAFMSISGVYKAGTLGILLSGANKDGAEGINRIITSGGRGIVQDPSTAESQEMPGAAIKMNERAEVLSPENIVNAILKII